MQFRPGVRKVFDWLVDGAPGAGDPVAVISRMLPELVEAGVPIARFSATVRTLHPHVVARSFTWRPGAKVEVIERTWDQMHHPGFLASAVKKVFDDAAELRVRLHQGEQTPFSEVAALAGQGITDYLALPFKFMIGSTHFVSYATAQAGGFSDEDVESLRHVTRALTRVAETLALMRTAVNLLNTYVGREAGERILKGRITLGDTELIRCVIWFSDLRGFTSLSGERTPKEIIGVLNAVFDCQVSAIEANGGQVLKFIGDGMLAIFPLDEKVAAKAAGEKALDATRKAYAELDALNARRAAQGEGALRFGVALHVGEVGYGNIGGANRLDFTAIGPAVNLASRIEGLTGKLDKRVLVSAELAGVLDSPMRSVGEFELKGVAKPQAVFEPAA